MGRGFPQHGGGHYTRANAILRAVMLPRLAEVVKASPHYDPSDYERIQWVRSVVFTLIKPQVAAREKAARAVLNAKTSAECLQAAAALRDV